MATVKIAADEIVEALNALHIECFKDTLNPDYTVLLLQSGGMVDRVTTDSPWVVISLDRKYISPNVYDLDDLMAAIGELHKHAAVQE